MASVVDSSFPSAFGPVRPLLPPAVAGPRYGGWKVAAVLGVMAAVIAAGAALGGELGEIASGVWEVLPFGLLAIFAQLGRERRWARVFTVVVLGAILLPACLASVMGSLAAAGMAVRANPTPDPSQWAGALTVFCRAAAGVGIAMLVAAAGLVPPIRRALARIIPLDPRSFVQTVALVAIVAVTLMMFVPLVVTSVPPLEPMVLAAKAQGLDMAGSRGTGGQLLDELYSLVWLVPMSILAVGYGSHRSLKEAFERLGLRRPTGRQVAAALGLAAALVVIAVAKEPAVGWLWDAMGWPKTNEEAVRSIFATALSPLGALVVGVVAGLGEELAVRGVLQPRLGIWLSNLFFTGLHAFQYNWDSLLWVFAIGLVLGVVRKKTNTATSAIVHGTFDFLLFLAVTLQLPWFST